MTSGSVGTWSDSSGNGLHATQATSAAKPTLVTNALNGQSVVQFDGNDSLSFTNYCLAGLTAGDVFAVVKSSGVAGTDNPLWCLGSPIVGFVSKYPAIDGSIMESFGTTSQVNIGKVAHDITRYNLLNAYARAGLNAVSINGIKQYERTENTFSLAGLDVRLGVSYSQKFTGTIAEIILYSRILTSTERAEVEAYLYSKYGLLPGVGLTTPASLDSATISSSQIALNWQDVLSTYGLTYDVERKTSATATYQKVAEIKQALSWIDNELTAGQEHWYRIRSRNAVTSSSWSSETSATVLQTGIPAVPFTSATVWMLADRDTMPGGAPQWIDGSGSGRSALQKVPAKMPQLVESVVAGKPVLRFDGGDDMYLLPDYTFSSLTQADAFILAKADVAVPATYPGLWRFGSGNASYYPYGGTGKLWEAFGRPSYKDIGAPVESVIQPHIYDVTAQVGNWTARLNGKTQFSETVPTVYFGNSGNTLGSGRGYADNVNNFDGDIAEVVVFDKCLRQSQRSGVYSYLMFKYGIGDADGDLMFDWWEQQQFGNTNSHPDGDSDSDGLTNYEEFLYRSNTTLADSDGDGLSDGNEVRLYNSDPILTDSDADGITDAYEVAYGLNAGTPDALLDPDKDGLYNIDEIDVAIRLGHYSDIWDADTNGDGIIDSVAVRTGVDPSHADFDLDGQAGTTELTNGTSPLIADTDKDGVIDPSDAFPHDQTRSSAPTVLPGDVTPPVPTIYAPRNASY